MMSDARIKRQHREAMKRAIQRYRRLRYHILRSDGQPFDFIATRLAESRHVRVVAGDPRPEDERAIRAVDLPPSCTRELYYETKAGYELREVP